MAKADLTAAQLRDLLDYAPTTGHFTWRHRPVAMFDGDRRRAGVWNARYAGKTAGGGSKVGYWTITVVGHAHWAHRLAILYVTGEWPAYEVDHVNGVKLDNRWDNLRAVDRTVNAQNIRQPLRSKKCGLPLGVHFKGAELRRPFYASIRLNGRGKHLGYFETPDQAHAAYLAAKRAAHQGCSI